jgi:hypothetical protein
MKDFIYIVDPVSKELQEVAPVSFSNIGIKERQDLQSWITCHPELMGETLLIITSEFSRFNKSDRRLDLLALDKDGKLVIVELKLDAAGTHADLQAIRYAALCSTMTMDNVVKELARFEKTSEEESAEKIAQFLGVDELPELGNQPRIILAAGSLDDQEITSSVLWLRTFGLDIRCMEITPYRMPGSEQIILVPKFIIPLPEAQEYQVRVEQKEASKASSSKSQTEYSLFWKTVADEFNQMGAELTAGTTARIYLAMRFGIPNVHYEWALRVRAKRIDVAIHFEDPDREINLKRLEILKHHETEIKKGVDLEFYCEPWGKKWAHAKFHVPFQSDYREPEIARVAAKTMKLLIERTMPILKGLP